MNYFPVAEGMTVKGAVLVCAGGAFQFRSDQMEGTPVAQWFARHGYQAFVVNYRVRPYTMEEGSLDLARAIRFVRRHAADYGINPNDIASVGFSAGGILCGDEALNFDELVNGTALTSDYRPDALDEVSANVCTIGMIYAFYGRLSVASTDVENSRRPKSRPHSLHTEHETRFTVSSKRVPMPCVRQALKSSNTNTKVCRMDSDTPMKNG